MKFGAFAISTLMAALAGQSEAVNLEQAAQNTPAINIIDNARIMMLPGSVPANGSMMAQQKSEDADGMLAQAEADSSSDSESEADSESESESESDSESDSSSDSSSDSNSDSSSDTENNSESESNSSSGNESDEWMVESK